MRNSSRKTVLKRVLAYALALALTLSVITVPSTDAYAASGSVKSVTVTNLPAKQVTIKKGKSFVLKTKVTTSGKISKAVVYKSSNSKVAKVTETGKITAVKKGSTYVTVYAKANKKKVCKVKVTVGTPVSSVKLSKASATIKKGKTLTLKATVSPKSASNKTLTWKSSNKKVATVSSKGVVKAVGAGTAKITATANDGSGKKYTCTVKVNIPVSSVKLDMTTADLEKNETVNLKVTVAPSNATNKSVKWSTSNAKVATVSAGKVTAKSTGTATITAAAADGSGKKAVCKVTVRPEINPDKDVEKVEINLTKTKIYVGQTTQASVKITPEDATNSKVTYSLYSKGSIDADTIATINPETGLVTAKNEGQVVVRATAMDNTNLFDDITLDILPMPTITFSNDSYSLPIGESIALQIANKDNLAVVFASSDPSVATVDEDGNVTAVKGGTTTITVALKDYPNIKDTCVVKVYSDSAILITSFTNLVQSGSFLVSVKMAKSTNKVSESDLIGTTLNIVNKTTGEAINATYAEGTLNSSSAKFEFDTSKLPEVDKESKSITYTYVLNIPANSKFAIKPDNGSSSLEADIEIQNYSSGIKGYIYDEYGEVVENAFVQVLAEEDPIGNTYTDNTGYYEIDTDVNDGYTVKVKKDGYFETQTSGEIEKVPVESGTYTTNNMQIETINESQRAIYGYVEIPKDVKDVSNVEATLYVKDSSSNEYKALKSVYVSDAGYYGFTNIDSSALTGSKSSHHDKFAGMGNYYRFSKDKDNVVLTQDDKYKVVISNYLGSNNNKYVCKEVSTEGFVLNKEGKVTELPNLTITKVSEFAGITIPAGEIKFKNRVSDDKEINLTCKIYPGNNFEVVNDILNEDSSIVKVANARIIDNGIYNTSVNVELDATRLSSKDEVKLFNDDKLTLPAGEYYALISTPGYANIRKQFTVDSKGTIVSIKNVSFEEAVDFKLNVQMNMIGDYLKSLPENTVVTLRDINNYDTDENAYVEASVYEIDENGTEIRTTLSEKINNFTVTIDDNGIKSITDSWPINGLIDGKKYRVKFSSPILSIAGSNSEKDDNGKVTQIYDSKLGYYEFTYDSKSPVSIPVKFGINANIEKIKFETGSQFEGFVTNKTLFVNYVKLLDSNGKLVAESKINKYFSCGKTDFEKDEADGGATSDDKASVHSPIYGGGDLIEDGIDVSKDFVNIASGENYKLEIKVNGFDTMTIPASGLKLEGLGKVTVTVAESEGQFKRTKDTYITGTIKNGNDLVTGDVYVTVKKGKKVVAVGVAQNGTYLIENDGKTAILKVGESYDVIFRTPGYQVQKESISKCKSSTVQDVALKKGAGTVEATIVGTNGGALVSENTYEVFATDKEYVDIDNDDLFATPDIKTIYSSGLFYNGKYDMEVKSGSAKWTTAKIVNDEKVKVPMSTYKVTVKAYETSTYLTTESSEKTLSIDGGTAQIDEFTVPNAVKTVKAMVTITVTKVGGKSTFDSNKDIVRIYKIEKDKDKEKEVFYTSCEAKTNTAVSSTFKVSLPEGKYVAYGYSKNYKVNNGERISISSSDPKPVAFTLLYANN